MRWRCAATILILVLHSAAACTTSGPEPVVIEVWFHQAEGPERSLLEDQVRQFNEQRDGLTVLLRVLPEVSYAEQVAEAAALGQMPDLLDVNRMMLATGAAGPLRPVGTLLSGEVRRSLVPELVTLGRVDGALMAVPTAAHAVLLAADVDRLREERLPVPGSLDDPWTLAETESALVALGGEDAPPLQLPDARSDLAVVLEVLVRSAGGNLTAGGTPSRGEAAVAATVERWLEAGLATFPAADDGGEGAGPPLALAGSESLPPGLLVAAPPDFGEGVVSTPTGFAWAVPEGGQHEEHVAELLAFLLDPEQVEATAELNGGAPVVDGALEVVSSGVAWRRARLITHLMAEGVAAPIPARARAAERALAFADAVLSGSR